MSGPVESKYEAPRLTKDEIEAQIARLTQQKQPLEPRDPFPVCPTTVRNQADIDGTVERLFSDAKRIQEKRQQRAEEILLPRATRTAVVPASVIDESVRHQYDEALEQRKRSQEASREKYLFHRKEHVAAVPLADFVQHMYHDQLQRERDKEKRLYDLYIAPTEVKSSRLTRSEILDSSHRLATTGR